MTSSMLDSQQTRRPSLTAGAWRVAPRSALALNPREPGQLQVVHGRLWVTCGAGDGGTPDASGDRVLEAGDRLTLAPGRRVVIEPLPRVAGGPATGAWFRWDVVPASALHGRCAHETAGNARARPRDERRRPVLPVGGVAARQPPGFARAAGAALVSGLAAIRRRVTRVLVDRAAGVA